jgi:tetratricopeptide (TPR) repeat protein
MTLTYWDHVHEDEETLHFNKKAYTDQVRTLCDTAQHRFGHIVKTYALISMAFIVLIAMEGIFFLGFMTTLSRSSMLAVSLAVLFLTVFAYFIMKLYISTKKPEQLLDLREKYLDACKDFIKYQEGLPEHHIALAHAAVKLAESLNMRQYNYYIPPKWLDVAADTMEMFSCWWHWHDVLSMRELMLSFAIEEHISVIKTEPTNLELHAALANAYVMLSGLYINPRTVEGYDEDKWIPPQRMSASMKEKFESTAQKAIEEFTILNDYAPNDPWVHSQLAYSYHDLRMPEKEIEQYEIILKLMPEDPEILYKLGILYFQEGMTAKGLQIYEILRGKSQKKATQLITFYGV